MTVQNIAKIDQHGAKIDQNGANMEPKWSKMEAWGLLGHPWELPWGPLGPRMVFYTDFGAFLAPFWEPKWCQKVIKNRDVFRTTFWDHFRRILEAILVQKWWIFGSFSEKREMSEYVILSTAPRREANSPGCRGTKIEENSSLKQLRTSFGVLSHFLSGFWTIFGNFLGAFRTLKSEQKQGEKQE